MNLKGRRKIKIPSVSIIHLHRKGWMTEFSFLFFKEGGGRKKFPTEIYVLLYRLDIKSKRGKQIER